MRQNTNDDDDVEEIFWHLTSKFGFKILTNKKVIAFLLKFSKNRVNQA